jgi:hypothetical protein
MAYPLPEEIKQHATELCGQGNLEVLDPGTMLKTDDGRWLVAVKGPNDGTVPLVRSAGHSPLMVISSPWHY